MRRAFLLTSLVALLISSFLIYNAMSIAVNQRWKEIGVLRALGVERAGNVWRMFLLDATWIGLVGSVSLGLAWRILSRARVSNRLTGTLSNVLSSSLVAVVVPEPPRFNTMFALEAVAIGIVVTVVVGVAAVACRFQAEPGARASQHRDSPSRDAWSAGP